MYEKGPRLPFQLEFETDKNGQHTLKLREIPTEIAPPESVIVQDIPENHEDLSDEFK